MLESQKQHVPVMCDPDQLLHLGISEQIANQQWMLGNFAQMSEQIVYTLLAQLLHHSLPTRHCLLASACSRHQAG